MPSPTEITLRAFISENFIYGDDASAIDAHASLIDEGLIDSTGVLELVSFLEEKFGLQITDAEIVPENLGSVAAIVGFVDRKAARPLEAA
ncbi:MAG: acyl carrier protein [Alphaproteobacteria bacterium]|nr:acyl carrier protein [Alphaproteobacteria bacterium]